MTEPNHITEKDFPGAAAQVSWPGRPAKAAAAGGQVPATDPAITSLLSRLSELPELPVEGHGEIYAGLHDELLAALNDSGTATSPGDTAHEQA